MAFHSPWIFGLLFGLAVLTSCGDRAEDDVSEAGVQVSTRVQFLFELPLVEGGAPPWSVALDEALESASFSVLGEPLAATAWKPLEGHAGFVRAGLRLALFGGPYMCAIKPSGSAEQLRPVANAQSLPASGEMLLRGQELILTQDTPRPLSIDYPSPRDSIAGRLGGIENGRLRAQRVRMKHGERQAVLLPTPLQLTYQVEVPTGGRLEFAVAVMPLALRVQPRGLELGSFEARSPRFRLRLEREDGQSTLLWERALSAAQVFEFHAVRVDLEAWSGELVRLHLETDQGSEASALNEHLLAAWSQPVLLGSEEDTRPNVLVLMLDTLRADRLGCYGNQRNLTPCLDALASRGVRFSDAMSAASWTLPSHASLFSSTYPSQHGLWKDQVLPTSLVTIAECLHDAGYRTAAFTEGGYLSTAHGFARGHECYDSRSRDCSLTLARAEAWIVERDHPYYAFVHTYQVHSPYEPPAEFRERFVRPYSGDLPTKVDAADYPWGHGGEPPSARDQRYISDLYDAELAYLDSQLERFLAKLKAAGALDNTMILVTSDHGEEFFEHGAALHGMSLYQEQLHVPLILSWPGHFEGGLSPSHAVHSVDIAPTIAAAAGVPAPASWVGAALSMQTNVPSRPLFVPMKTLWSDALRTGERAVSLREGKFKYIAYPAGLRRFDEHPAALLFDLAQDPGETHNLLDEAGALEWARKLDALYASYPEVESAGAAEQDAATRAELRRLGYVGEDKPQDR